MKKILKTLSITALLAAVIAIALHQNTSVAHANREVASATLTGGDGTGPKAPQGGGDGTTPRAKEPLSHGGDGTNPKGGDGTNPKRGGDGTNPKMGGDGTGPKASA